MPQRPLFRSGGRLRPYDGRDQEQDAAAGAGDGGGDVEGHAVRGRDAQDQRRGRQVRGDGEVVMQHDVLECNDY